MVEEEVDARDAGGQAVSEDADELAKTEQAMSSEQWLDSQEPAGDLADSRSFKIVHPSLRRKMAWAVRKRLGGSPRPSIRLKLLPLLGAVLGLSSFMLPWDHLPAYSRESFHRLGDYVIKFPGDYSYLLAIAAAIVLVGAILLFVTAFGGFIQLSGIGLFVYGMPGEVSQLEIGFVICLCGAVLGCSSLLIRSSSGIPLRLLTIAPDPTKRGGAMIGLVPVGCLLVGVIASFLPWFVVRYSWRYSSIFPRSDYVQYETLVSFFLDQNESMLIVTAASVFIIGTFLAILTPLGGIVQGVGVASFFVGAQPRLMMGFSAGGYDAASTLGPGFFVGIVAAALGVLGSFLPARIKLSTRSIVVTGSEWPKEEARSWGERLSALSSAARPAISRLFTIVIAMTILLASAVCVAALAYTQKWSSLMIFVDVLAPQDELAEVVIQVDESEVFSEVAIAYSTVIAESHVRAGTHKISIDFCFLSIDPEGIDGDPDWSTYCEVRPFYQTRVQTQIGTLYERVQTIGTQSDSVVNGTEVTFGSYEWDSVWAPWYVGWSDITLLLTDGTDYVRWALSSTDLDDREVTEMTYEDRSLGETVISCIVTDLYGNGQLNPGDFITLLSVDGTTFDEEANYSLLVMYDPAFGQVGECELVF